MPSYQIILADFLLFSLIWLSATKIANRYPGAVKQSSRNKGDAADIQWQQCRRHSFLGSYVILLTLALLLLESFLTELLEQSAVGAQVVPYLTLERSHSLIWLMLWASNTGLYWLEMSVRRSIARRGGHFPVSSLLRAVLHMVVLCLVAMWALHYILGWQGSHILVSSAVMITVAGFFLKGVTNDFLSGIVLHAGRSVALGDWIAIPRLMIEGEVIVANWREIRLRTTGGHLHVIPNAHLAAQAFQNNSWPDPIRRHELRFVISASINPKRVEEALLIAVEQVDKVLDDHKKQVVIKSFAEYGVVYLLRFWSETYHDRASLESGIYQRAWRELAKRKIRLALAPLEAKKSAQSSLALMGSDVSINKANKGQ